MKRFVAILLLSIYFISCTELYELMKINALLEHFAETRKQDGDISFVHFIIMHYVTDDGNSKDNERDRQLPFKSATGYTAGNLPVFVVSPQEEFIVSLPVAKNNIFYNHYDTPVSSSFHNLVWNPPRAV